MDAIMKIKDDHKRAFALGFKFLFEKQKKMHQSAVALAANVPPAAITAIMRGYEERFPSLKAQDRISKVFNTDVYTLVDIGRKIQAGYRINAEYYTKEKEIQPKHSDPEVQAFIERFDLDGFGDGLNGLSTYEQQIIKICRSFKEDQEFLQDFYDFACDLFVSYQSKSLKKLRKK
jgi:transcriptional regulator with XRE-family HTH domain